MDSNLLAMDSNLFAIGFWGSTPWSLRMNWDPFQIFPTDQSSEDCSVEFMLRLRPRCYCILDYLVTSDKYWTVEGSSSFVIVEDWTRLRSTFTEEIAKRHLCKGSLMSDLKCVTKWERCVGWDRVASGLLDEGKTVAIRGKGRCGQACGQH